MSSPSLISWFYIVALSLLVAAGRFDEDLAMPSNVRHIRRGSTNSVASPQNHQLHRRLGPFISGGLTAPKRLAPHRPPLSASGQPSRVHHHPYMEQPHHTRGHQNRRHQSGAAGPPPYRYPRPPPPTRPTAPQVQNSWPLPNTFDSPPPPLLAQFTRKIEETITTSTTPTPINTIKRKLLVPIISSGYASTNFQGGNRGSEANNENAIDGDEIALQVVASNDVEAYDTVHTNGASTSEDDDSHELHHSLSEESNNQPPIRLNVNVVEQAKVSVIPNLSWSSTTIFPPISPYERTTPSEAPPPISESSPYFPLIPQVVQTKSDDESILIGHDVTNEAEQDVASIIKDQLTNIFEGSEQGGMYDETEELLAFQKVDNNYYSVDISSSFGAPVHDRSETKIDNELSENDSPYVGTVEEVPLFNKVDFSSSNTRQHNTETQKQEETSTTTPSPFILQPGSPLLSTRLEDATSITEDQLLDMKDKDQYVRFVATPPKQINIHIPPPATDENTQFHHGQHDHHSSSLDASGHFIAPAQDSVPYSPFYQAGYHSTVPGESNGGGQFPGSIDPSVVDPNIYHEDRPTFGTQFSSSSTIGQEDVKSIYPLGKAPPKNEYQLQTLLGKAGKGPANRQNLKVESGDITLPSSSAGVRKPKPTASSFLDFLIPSFLSGRGSSNRADPEGPSQQKQPQATKPTNGGLTRLKKLPVPTRPPNTFPEPQELGGRLNPILIKVPNGFPPVGPPPELFPKPPTIEDWERHVQEQQNALASRSGNHTPKRAQQEEPVRSTNLIEEETSINAKMRGTLYAADLHPSENEEKNNQRNTLLSNEIENSDINGERYVVKQTRPMIKLPIPPPPIASLPTQGKRIPSIHPPKQPILQKTPLPMTSQPVIGLPRVPPGRKQAPFLKGPKHQPLRPPMVGPPNAHHPLIRKHQLPPPQHKQYKQYHQNPTIIRRNPNLQNRYPPINSDYVMPTKASKEQTAVYLAKLKDPEFVQNLTKSYVYHHKHSSNNENSDNEKNIVGYGPISYVPQASDPFFFRSKSAQDKISYDYDKTRQSNKFTQPQKSSGFVRHDLPRLDLIAPPSRPVSKESDLINNRLDVNVVYQPEREEQYAFVKSTTPKTSSTTSATTTQASSSLNRPLEDKTAQWQKQKQIAREGFQSEWQDSATNSNPIAEHISSLLKHYLSTERPAHERENLGVPTLLYDTKQNTIVLEYVSPDGEKLNHSGTGKQQLSTQETKLPMSASSNQQLSENIARVDDGADTLIATEGHNDAKDTNMVIEDITQIEDILLNDEGFASYLTHLQEQKQHAIGTGKTIQGAPALPILNLGTSVSRPLAKLPHQHSMPTTGNGIIHHSATVPHSVNVKKTFQLEKVFEPSATPTESDWFILDESGKRQRTMTNAEIEDVKHVIEDSHTAQRNNLSSQKDDPEFTTDLEAHESKDVYSTNTFEEETSNPNSSLVQDNSVEETIDSKTDKVKMYGGFEPSVGPQ